MLLRWGFCLGVLPGKNAPLLSNKDGNSNQDMLPPYARFRGKGKYV